MKKCSLCKGRSRRWIITNPQKFFSCLVCDVCANNMVSHKIGYEKWCKVKYGDLPIIDFYKNATKIKNGTATLKEIKREIWLSKNSRLPTVNRIFTE